MGFRKLAVYKKAFQQAMIIFELTKKFPKEERYSLTDQIRKSSRSVCANIAEAYRKRCYPAHFKSKVTDSEMENSETLCWLEFALKCKYIVPCEFEQVESINTEVGKLLYHMRSYPKKYT